MLAYRKKLLHTYIYADDNIFIMFYHHIPNIRDREETLSTITINHKISLEEETLLLL